jgi:dihydrolipoamide dehydrogenase
MRTNVPGIYAVGDVKGTWMLAHVAEREGVVAAENIAGHDTTMSYAAVPSIVFTDPEISVVGKRERELKADGVPYTVGSFPVSASGKARTMDERTACLASRSTAPRRPTSSWKRCWPCNTA